MDDASDCDTAVGECSVCAVSTLYSTLHSVASDRPNTQNRYEQSTIDAEDRSNMNIVCASLYVSCPGFVCLCRTV